jgi:hypothetical protein
MAEQKFLLYFIKLPRPFRVKCYEKMHERSEEEVKLPVYYNSALHIHKSLSLYPWQDEPSTDYTGS